MLEFSLEKIVEEDAEILENYIPDIRDLVQIKDPADILEMIDDLIVDDIVEHDDEPSDVGRQLQLIYDRIGGTYG